jgi:drug/metabolite transporter (DMT)-like permease
MTTPTAAHPTPPHHRMSRASAIRLALLACLWGSSFLFIKLALDGLSPVQIVLARMTPGALVLLAIVAVRHERLPREPTTWARITIAAIIANLIPYFLFGWGEQRVDSAIAGTLNSTTPLFTLAIAYATRTEPTITRQRAGGFLLGFVGAVLIVAPWNSAGGSTAGALACLAAALSYGVSYVYMRRYLTGRGTSSIALAAAQITTGALLLLITAPVLANQAVDLQPDVLASVLALGALGTGLAYLLNYRLIQDEGATTASTVTYLLPIVAVILGAIVLGEPITWNLVVGTGVVLAGVAISDGRFSRRHARPQAA